VILNALWQVLNEEKKVAVFTQLKPSGLQISKHSSELALSNGETLCAKLIIAADGANSWLREHCKLTTKGWDYHQSAIVANVSGEVSHALTAFQRFAPDGPLALLPLADPMISSIVWTTTPDNAKNLCQLSEQEFSQTLTHEINYVMGKMTLLSERINFPLRTHHALSYAIDRCVLVGDAAHSLHPLAGQGVNLGLLDVSALIQQLTRAKNKHRDIGNIAVLKRYERQRKLHNQIMIMAMESFKQGFGSRSSIVQRVRNIGLNWVDRQGALKSFFAKMALGYNHST
jgi:2-octaprenylphenol hydroxylase